MNKRKSRILPAAALSAALAASLFPLAGGEATAKQPAKTPPAATAQQQEPQPSPFWVVANDDSWACRADNKAGAIRTTAQNGKVTITRYEALDDRHIRTTTWFDNSDKDFYLEMVSTSDPRTIKFQFNAPQGYLVNSDEADRTGNVARFIKTAAQCDALYDKVLHSNASSPEELQRMLNAHLLPNDKMPNVTIPSWIEMPQDRRPATMVDIE
jgi:hypothetical protein